MTLRTAMPSGLQPFYHLSTPAASVIIDCRHAQPVIAYMGPRVNAVSESALAQHDRHEAPASLRVEPAITLTPTAGESYLGHLGLTCRRGDTDWALNLRLQSAEATTDCLRAISQCDNTLVTVTHRLELDPHSAVLRLTVNVQNTDETAPLSIDSCLLTVPVDDRFTDVLTLSGRWGYEFQQEQFALPPSTLVRENRTGRTSHHCHPSLTLLTSNTSTDTGRALSVQVGWSGNHTLRVETLADGRKVLQAGELLEPGEVTVAPGDSYTSPDVFLCVSHRGTNALAQGWHQFIRQHLATPPRNMTPANPVQINTWEALYFDVNEANVTELIDASARLGVERFVLDDGWFKGRHNDRSSLGDWTVDRDKFPAGLTPLIASCQSHGIEFGLWIEPEMVSRDSDLFRSHPDWVLKLSGVPLNEARHQLVLDLHRPEVTEYLFTQIATLLQNNAISYLKWDMNRDIHQAGNAAGNPAGHGQTRALYALMARVREQFPEVALESCASGGGRVDLGIHRYVSRFWPSDTNDALDRLNVQSGFLSLFPPECMGSHVGPSPCHLTGRQHSMAFRAGVALWGHMGVEADIRELTDDDTDTLRAAISLHKQHRSLLHTGDFVAHDCARTLRTWSLVSRNRREALSAVAMLETPTKPFPHRLVFSQLDESTSYRVSLVWPQSVSEPQAAHRDALASLVLGGDWLMSVGLTLPIMPPESVLIYHLLPAD